MNEQHMFRKRACYLSRTLIALVSLLAVTTVRADSQANSFESDEIRFDHVGAVSDFVCIRDPNSRVPYTDIEVVDGRGTGKPSSGAVVPAKLGGGNIAVIYAPDGLLSKAGIKLDPNQMLVLRVKFRVDSPFSPTSRLGLVGHDDLMRQTDGGARTDIDLKGFILGGVPSKPEDDGMNRKGASFAIDLQTIDGTRGKKKLLLMHTSTGQAPEQMLATDEPAPNHKGRWCQYELQLTKLDRPGQFNVSCRYNLLDNGGNWVESTLSKIDNHTFTNTALYEQQYVAVGFSMVRGHTDSFVSAYDDFEFVVVDTGAVALPEPITGLVPLAFALLVIGQRRRRQLSRD